MKHAVLMTVHNNVPTVRALMRLLDDSRFGFYILVDSKSKYAPKDFIPKLHYSKVTVLPQIQINWAGYSQIEAELLLIESALKDGNDYLHYLQGADLPLKIPDRIDEFFSKGGIFMKIDPNPDFSVNYKVLCKHLLVDCKGFRNSKLLKLLNHCIVCIQKPFMKYKRWHNKLYAGSALWSIPSDFAEYVLSLKGQIKKSFKYTLAADEIFIHTICMNSNWKNSWNNVLGESRLIDWKNREGNSPKTFTMEDIGEIKNAISNPNIMFARKFNSDRDLEIIDFVEKTIGEMKNDPKVDVKMKILFTSVGRRVELIESFRNAARELNIPLEIIGTDISNTAPALYFCDKREIVCRINSEEYIPQLLSICENEGIDCLIPTIDTDLLKLAESKERFEALGTKVLISSVEKIKPCRDKNLTADYFISLGLKSPRPVNSVELYEREVELGNAVFPAFIKPKDGSSSINAYKVKNAEDLKMYSENIEDYIIQPFIDGREYTVDIFCDYEGNPVYITPRERLEVRTGEVSKTGICQDETMIAQMQTLIADFKPCGQITVQLIKDGQTGENYYIEINPRFGGGSPISMLAGANSARATLEMLRGKSLSYVPFAAKDGLIYCRYDQSVCINEDLKK